MEWFLAMMGAVLAAAVLSALVRQAGQGGLALVLGLAVGVLLCLQLLPLIEQVLAAFATLAQDVGLAGEYWAVLLKIVLISYLAELGAALCRDAAESAMAAKLELAGRLAVIMLALPVVVNMLRMVLEMLP